MSCVQSKTLAPLLMLRILEEYSDEKHPLTREELERILENEYGITMERKAFFRHMEHLQELDNVDIRRVTVKPTAANKSACAGFYLADRMFTETELRVIIDALSGSHFLSQWETKDLVQRLAGLSTRYFRKKMASYQFIGSGGKTENETLMLNLELIDEAIAAQRQIRFDNLHFGNDGKPELTVDGKHTGTPLLYFVKEHIYHLMCLECEEGKPRMSAYNLAYIANVEITELPAEDVRSVPEFKYGVDWPQLLQKHPEVHYLDGNPTLCTFLCCRWMVDEIKMRFGTEFHIRQLSDEENTALADAIPAAKKKWLIELSLVTDPSSAMEFAWSNPNSVWLIGPDDAKRRLLRKLKTEQNRYECLGAICEALKIK